MMEFVGWILFVVLALAVGGAAFFFERVVAWWAERRDLAVVDAGAWAQAVRDCEGLSAYIERSGHALHKASGAKPKVVVRLSRQLGALEECLRGALR